MSPLALTPYQPCFNVQGPLKVPVPTDRVVRELGRRASVMMGAHFLGSFPGQKPILSTRTLLRYDIFDEKGWFSTGLRPEDRAMSFAWFKRSARGVSVKQFSGWDDSSLTSRYQVQIPFGLASYLPGELLFSSHPRIRISENDAGMDLRHDVRHGLEEVDPDFARFFDAARAMVEYHSAG